MVVGGGVSKGVDGKHLKIGPPLESKLTAGPIPVIPIYS